MCLSGFKGSSYELLGLRILLIRVTCFSWMMESKRKEDDVELSCCMRSSPVHVINAGQQMILKLGGSSTRNVFFRSVIFELWFPSRQHFGWQFQQFHKIEKLLVEFIDSKWTAHYLEGCRRKIRTWLNDDAMNFTK